MKFTAEEESLILDQSGLRSVLPKITLAVVREKYSEPTRHYHDWHHALSVLSWVNHVCEYVPEDDLAPYTHLDLRLAALFHDVIYTTQGSPGNERDSADVLQSYGISFGFESKTAEQLILATAQHGKLESQHVDEATGLFLDCDIASFGEVRWEIVVWNDMDICKELLQKYNEDQIKIGRKAFLQGLLDKESIFLSTHFLHLERQARRNIRKLISERY